jgi:hypothetical protein
LGSSSRNADARSFDSLIFEERPAASLDPPLTGRRQGSTLLTALDRHERIHQPEPFEGVSGVADFTGEDLAKILFDVGPSERSPAEEDRVRGSNAPPIQFLEVLLHHNGGLDQQPRHADGISVMLFGRLDDRGDRLLDSQIHHGVAVIGEDDVDQVLADVVHITLDRGEHDCALAAGVGLL